MTITIPNIKPSMPRKLAKQLASDGFIPVIALEAFVEAGRTYQAYKRGGFDEARERITEEFSGAIFWLGGVTGLNWLFEKIGQKVLNLPNIEVSAASDEVRKPLTNYLANETKKNGGKILEKTMARFKFIKVISSVVLANAFIGFVLPKINQAITRSYHKNDKKNVANNSTDQFVSRPTIEGFTKNKEDNKNKKDVSFGMNLLTLANKFENDRNYRLLSVDAGTASGRAYSARNNDERVEILFRDLSSVFFYMFNMPLMNKMLNNIEQGGISSRLDPVSTQYVTEYMNNYLDTKNSKTANVEEFEREMLGKNVEFNDSLKAKFKNTGIITLDEFKQELKAITPADKLAEMEKIAEEMSTLQPKIKGTAILSKSQLKAILSGGHINDPSFLKQFYTQMCQTMFGNPYTKKYSFVSQSDLDSYKADLENYVKSVIKKAKEQDGNITKSLLSKLSSKNLKINLLNWGSAFAVSALFLSTIIPKLQYAITRWRTGSNNFPGTAQYRDEKK